MSSFTWIDTGGISAASVKGARVVPSQGNTPPLRRVHPDSVYQSGSARLALEYWRKEPTDAIVDSLRPGQIESLRVKPDGRIMNGNPRIKVLEERGYDVSALPREIV